jgi:hypothetical protein
MKFFWIFLLSMAPAGAILNAQGVWEKQDIQLRYGVKGMYYDSLGEKSYVHGWTPLYVSDSNDTTNILMYDGAVYSAMPKPLVTDVWTMVRYKGKLYAGGMGLAGLAAWNGVEWETIEDNGAFFNLKVIDDKLFAMGNFEHIAGVPARGIAVWNDTVWTSFLGTDTVTAPETAISDILYYKGSVYICGNFYHPDYLEYPYDDDIIMYREDSGWQRVGDFRIGGLGGLHKMLVWRDTLYIAGLMGESSGAPGNCVAAWDGENWHRLQNGVGSPDEGSSAARDIRIYNDELWVTGHFTLTNGYAITPDHGSVAKWDGSKWCTMDFRRMGNSSGFGMWKDELFVVGEVHMLDDTSSRRIVKWVGGDYTDTCVQDLTTAVESIDAAGLMFEVYPNPTNGELHLTFHNNGNLKVDDQLNVRIFDLHGRVVLSESSKVKSGTNRLSLDATGLASGIYYLDVITGYKRNTKKVLKLSK